MAAPSPCPSAHLWVISNCWQHVPCHVVMWKVMCVTWFCCACCICSWPALQEGKNKSEIVACSWSVPTADFYWENFCVRKWWLITCFWAIVKFKKKKKKKDSNPLLLFLHILFIQQKSAVKWEIQMPCLSRLRYNFVCIYWWLKSRM